jgi:hypothetical protein
MISENRRAEQYDKFKREMNLKEDEFNGKLRQIEDRYATQLA